MTRLCEVQHDRASEVAPQVVSGEVLVVRRAEWSGYGAVLTLQPSLLKRSGNDADVGDASAFDGVHDGGKGSEGNLLVGTKIDDALGWVAATYGLETGGQVIYVDRLVLKKDVLILVDGDYHALFSELIDGAGLRNCNFDA